MPSASSCLRLCVVGCLVLLASALSIAEINGNRYLSPYQNQNVTNVTGLVTAIGPNGLWIRSTTPDNDDRTSESLYIFDNVAARNLSRGDIVRLDGRISEYRSSSAYIHLTELTRPANIKVLSRNNSVPSIVLGNFGTSPPTEQFSSLDKGDVYGLPSNTSQLSKANPILEPARYGLDFWEALSGELVTVKRPVAASKPNQYGDTWVVGSWVVTGQNKRGGVTMTDKDSNPEAIMVGDPLDGTANPNSTRLGDSLADVTGIVTQSFGFYTILPLTAIKISNAVAPASPPPTSFKSRGTCSALTVGSYNVENLAPDSGHLPSIADHIVNHLKSPDLMFLQEIQDNDGPTDDGVVTANVTLTKLIDAITSKGGVKYAYADIDPENDQDGGQPGGNIRVAYLYNPAVIRLKNGTQGSSSGANEVLPGPTLKYNPGRIDPANPAWRSSRKPLVAQWQHVRGNSTFFTINVHLTSKGGSSSIEGDPRPPVNGGVSSRSAQANLTAAFVSQILSYDTNASVITAGDFNEFAFVAPLKSFASSSGLTDLDVAAGVPPVERYTYLFDMNCQQLDHVYVSKKIASRVPKYEHVHVNTWASSADQVSDHDPSVAMLNPPRCSPATYGIALILSLRATYETTCSTQRSDARVFSDERSKPGDKNRDLLTWRYAPVLTVLKPDKKYDRAGVFTGCLGPFTHRDELSIFYTSIRSLPFHWTDPAPRGTAGLSLATSSDDGLTWRKSNSNPILNEEPPGLDVTGFRVPYLAAWPSLDRLRGTRSMYGLISGGLQGVGPTTFLYAVDLDNVKRWEYIGPLVDIPLGWEPSPKWEYNYGVNWECVNFMTLRAGSATRLPPRNIRGQQWMVGDLVRTEKGIRLKHKYGGILDHGCYYAAKSFSDPVSGRRVVFGWIPEEDCTVEHAHEKGWNGCQAFPRELFLQCNPQVTGALVSQLADIASIELVPQPNGTVTVYTLGVRPIQELEKICESAARIQSFRSIALPPSRTMTMQHLTNTTGYTWKLRCRISVDPENCQSVGLHIRHSPDLSICTTVTFSLQDESISIDRSSSAPQHPNFNERTETGAFTLVKTVNSDSGEEQGVLEKLCLHVISDEDVLEVFANERFAMASMVYSGGYEVNGGVSAFAKGSVGCATVEHLTVWDGLNASRSCVLYEGDEEFEDESLPVERIVSRG